MSQEPHSPNTNGHRKNGNGRKPAGSKKINPIKTSPMKSDYIWMDGELVDFASATVHVLTPTLHYGTGIFEGIRCYDTRKGPGIFRLTEHLKRFFASARIAGIRDLPYSLEDLRKAVHMTVRANRFASCYIRPLILMVGPLGLNLDNWQPSVSIATWDWGPFLGQEAFEKGVRAMVSSFTRHHPNVMMTKAKISGNYVNSTLAKTLAVRAGFDETIMLDTEGFVAECSGENLFVVRDGMLYTPPRTAILEGVTRDALIVLAKDLGYQVMEEPISRDQLYIADEAFVCGTAAEVVPVCEIDTRRIADGRRGPVTAALQKAFNETITGNGAHSAEWLDYVEETVLAV
jgi:branched-chain amino acid aminotransferase